MDKMSKLNEIEETLIHVIHESATYTHDIIKDPKTDWSVEGGNINEMAESIYRWVDAIKDIEEIKKHMSYTTEKKEISKMM
jgi:hypothetical protein